MKATTPASKKTRKAFNPHSSTHQGREQAASGLTLDEILCDMDAAGVQALNVLEELAERDTALFESLDTQGGDVID